MTQQTTPMPKIRTVCIDTLTGIMNEMYMTSSKKPTHDKWMDWGKGVWQLINSLQERGFEIVLILGEPGTGKSSGMRTLPPKTNIWYNADNKNPVWLGGKAEYGKKHNPKIPYHMIPKTYKDITTHIDEGLKHGMFEEERYAILTGHTEDYRTATEVKRRLKIIGNVATKMQLEAKLETVLYSKVQKDTEGIHYLLETQNSGFNTARSPQGIFEPIIDNDYGFIIKELLEKG